MVFRFPFLAVPGNHDYYNLPRAYSVFVQLTNPIRQVLGIDLTPNVGWHGSGVGDAYARAFLDYLKGLSAEKTRAPPRRSLRPPGRTKPRDCSISPGEFTRLPNRYYTFRYGGIDFFALDSSTF